MGGDVMTKEEQFERMSAALRNILDITSCDFAKSQARFGLGMKKTNKSGELENRNEETKQ